MIYRDIYDWKGMDLSKLTSEERVEFSLAKGIEGGGMNCHELKSLDIALTSLGGKPLTILETGMGCGYSTRMMLCHILKNGGELHSVELKIQDALRIPMQKLGLWDMITLHQEDSRVMNWDSTKHIDFLNLDSEHSMSFVMSEYFMFRKALNKTSLIGFHDVDGCPGVRKGIDVIRTFDKMELFDKAHKGGFGYESYRIVYKDYQPSTIGSIEIGEVL